MKAQYEISKWIASLVVIALIMVGSLVLFQIRSASSWTNPPALPPSGGGGLMRDAVTGNLGINTQDASTTLTIGGTLSLVGNAIKDVQTPTEDFDAANKLYVDAAAGAGQSFTLFGIAKQSMNWNPATGMYTQITIPGGTGVPPCPAGYGSVLDGYGPHGVIAGAGWSRLPGGFSFSAPDDLDFFTPDLPEYQRVVAPTAVSPTYSTCAASEAQIVPTAVPLVPVGGGDVFGYITAKACENFIDNTPPLVSAFRVCNTCRVCVKGVTPQVWPAGNVPPDSRW